MTLTWDSSPSSIVIIHRVVVFSMVFHFLGFYLLNVFFDWSKHFFILSLRPKMLSFMSSNMLMGLTSKDFD